MPEHMKLILEGVKVDTLLEQLAAHPELWDRNNMRTTMFENSPHREVHDIWLRYRDFSEFDPDNPQDFASEHDSCWYPAIEDLPEARKIIEEIVTVCGIDQLGGVLITKIPAWASVYPHNDKGFWHSEFYKDKFLLLLKSAPGQSFNFKDESHEGKAGDLSIFTNLVEHSVTNDSDVERISLIIAARKD